MPFDIKDCYARWKLRTPITDNQLETPKFRFGKDDCSLVCRKSSDPDEIVLSLTSRETEKSSEPYNVTVQVQTTSGRILPSLTATRRYVNVIGLAIWRKHFSDLKPHYTDLGYSHSWDVDYGITDECFELAFFVTFEVAENPTDELSVQTSLAINPIPSYESLSEDLAQLLDSDSNHDVEFQCDGQSTKAHRLIVSARSPVLATMLQSQMVEGTTGVLKIEDIDLDTLRLFVRYLYTGRLAEAPTFETAMALYEAADKYQVQGLARRCADSLIEGLTVENACTVLVVAHRHIDKWLEGEVTDFILENEVPSISLHWEEFCSSHPLLAKPILKRYDEEVLGIFSSPPKKRHCEDNSPEQK